jgi:ubiquinone/menaquinone biosynthesis C-methylase UbiE
MTREIFDKAAADWDKNALRLELSRKVAAAIKKSIPLNRDMDSLEIGCGTGLVTTELAGDVHSIIATDTSENMLRTLTEKIAGQSLINIQPLHIDLLCDQSALAGKTFHLIYSSMTLHHIKDTGAVLRTCLELLAPCGFLAIADLEKEDGTFHGDMPGVEHLGFHPQDLAALALACGFAHVNLTTAHVISKENGHGQQRDYPVFLMTAQKENTLW